MKAVLMAGGSGTRLRPLTCSIPKPMVPIANRPIICHIAELLKKHNFNDVIVTLYYLPSVIQNFLKDGSDRGMNISYSIEESMPLGTAGCVKNIEKQLNKTFIVISGDALTDFNLQDALKFHKEKGSLATIVLTRVPNPLEFGVVITDENGKIERFLEKPSSSEVFSDTINTGIYILEPEVLKYLPANTERDFSKDLFPLLLKKNSPMYGYVAEGYWCDIGNLDAYRQANYDVLNGVVKTSIPYIEKEKRKGIWIGERAIIEKDVKLEAPLIIGHNCYIGKGVTISKNTVIGDNVIVSEECVLKRPIIWNDVYCDKRVSLSGCIIGQDTTIKTETQILEGAVVGDSCSIQAEVLIKPNVRVWPVKTIEKGSILKESLVWGSGIQKSLFGESGVRGIINLDITPEFVVKIGAAYGATIGMGKSVAVSRDSTPAAGLVSRALFAGILSVGVNIRNLEETQIPITRHRMSAMGVVGGIHIRSDYKDPEKVSIEFLDFSGLNISPSQEKKIESTYYKEDFRRAVIEEIGEINYPGRIREKYTETFIELLEKYQDGRALKIIVDYSYRATTTVLPALLAKLNIDTVVLNANLVTRPLLTKKNQLKQLSEVVIALHADFGVVLDDNSERLILVDDKGHVVEHNKLFALMAKLVAEDNPNGKVVVPVDYPNVIDKIIEPYGCKTLMTKSNERYLMETAKEPDVIFAGTAKGKFIYPYLHCGFDAMFSTALLACLVAKKDMTVSQLVEEIPTIHFVKDFVPCMSEYKGTVIRNIVDKTRGLKVDLLDGIKIYEKDGDGWVLILPEASNPIINIYADGSNSKHIKELAKTYKDMTADIIEKAEIS